METNAVTQTVVDGATAVLDFYPWGILTTAVAFLCSLTLQWMAGSIVLAPLKDRASGHWTERARLAAPIWRILVIGQIVTPLIWALVVSPFHGDQGNGTVIAVALAAFLGAGIASTRLESKARQRTITLQEWAQSWAVLLLFFLPAMGIFLFMSWCLPDEFNQTATWIILGAVGAVLMMTFRGSVILARWLGLLRPPTPKLRAIVDLAVQRMGVKAPRVYALRWKVCNALAFPLDQSIAVTETALNSLTDEQLVAVTSHELAHLNEPRYVHLARVAGCFVWMPAFLFKPLYGELGEMAFAVVIGLPLCGIVLVQRLTLAMEKRADAAGKAHEGDAGTYAKALEKLYEVNLTPAVVRAKLRSHPHLYDRLVAAGVQPEYPRPQPPPLALGRIATVLLVLGGLVGVFLWLGLMKTMQSP